MNTRCTVCHHPQRREIEQERVARVTLRELAKKYGKGKSTIFKHIKGHVPDAAQKAMAAVIPTKSSCARRDGQLAIAGSLKELAIKVVEQRCDPCNNLRSSITFANQTRSR